MVMVEHVCLAVRTLTFCQLVGFPLNHCYTFSRGAESNRVMVCVLNIDGTVTLL